MHKNRLICVIMTHKIWILCLPDLFITLDLLVFRRLLVERCNGIIICLQEQVPGFLWYTSSVHDTKWYRIKRISSITPYLDCFTHFIVHDCPNSKAMIGFLVIDGHLLLVLPSHVAKTLWLVGWIDEHQDTLGNFGCKGHREYVAGQATNINKSCCSE